MSQENNSDSSTSESEISACGSNYNPAKVLYSKKVKIPVNDAPMYENIQQFDAAQKNQDILPVGYKELVEKREKEKEMKRLREEKELEKKNMQRFAQYQFPTHVRRERTDRNVLTRIDNIEGPLGALRTCVDQRLRIKVITRSEKGVRGVLHANLVAFDKQWNLAMTDVLEIWTRKRVKKRKIPPGLSTQVAKGTAATISPVPVVTETPLGGGLWECSRHVPQMMVRGEHVVLINVVER